MTEVRAYLNFGGARRDGKLIKGVVPQFDGSPYAGNNCAGASEAHRVRAHAQGKVLARPWPPTGALIRSGTGDTSGGMTAQQTTAVSARLWDVPRDIRVVPFADVEAWLRKRGSLTLLVRYRAIAEAGKSGSPGFYGAHSLPLAGWRDTSGVQLLDCDPLYDGRRAGIPEGPQWLARGVLLDAAGDLDLGNGISVAERYGGSHALVSFGVRLWTPPPPTSPFKLRKGAVRLAKPRIYTPRYAGSWLRRTPALLSTNRLGRVNPGFLFRAYQYDVVNGRKWVGNKDGTAWMLFSGVRFVRYI